jgi:hypothetical protein
LRYKFGQEVIPGAAVNRRAINHKRVGSGTMRAVSLKVGFEILREIKFIIS